MSAVRMVAYGVLELRLIASGENMWLPFNKSTAEAENKEYNDQIRKAVSDELARYDLQLLREVKPYKGFRRTSEFTYVLYGQKLGCRGFTVGRAQLYVGGFRACCTTAARLLDELDAAQIPDTATGND